MKKLPVAGMAALLLVCMLASCAHGTADTSGLIVSSATTSSQPGDSYSGPVEALTIDKLSTRSGPSTEYRETGTYNVKGEYVRVLSLAYDKNDVCWLQCEVEYGNKLRRVYTGLKRFDVSSFDLGSVPEEDPLDYPAKATSTSKALYGPGGDYGTYSSLTVDKGQSVAILAIEGDYAQVEWTTSQQSYRAWVPVHTLKY